MFCLCVCVCVCVGVCVCVCVCVRHHQLQTKFLKTQDIAVPLSSVVPLSAFQSLAGWLRPGHREGEARAAYDWTEAEETQCTQIHTCRRTHTLFPTGGSSSVLRRGGSATKRPHWGRADKQRWPWAEGDDWTIRWGRETSNNLQDEKIKGKGKKDGEEKDEREAEAPV